jgi:hypothetical protein
MARYVIVEWRGIPAVVEAEDGGETVSRQLGERFQALIDSVAMLRGREGAEAYLEEWVRSEPREQGGSAREVAEAIAADLESRFHEFAARALQPG